MSIFNEFLGKRGTLFLKNNFRYYGIVAAVENPFLKFDDLKTGKQFLFNLDSIQNFEVDLQ